MSIVPLFLLFLILSSIPVDIRTYIVECERNRRPNINSAVETPVVLYGVMRYLKRNCDNLVSSDPSLIFFISSLKVYTALSARPLEGG